MRNLRLFAVANFIIPNEVAGAAFNSIRDTEPCRLRLSWTQIASAEVFDGHHINQP